MFGRAPVFFAAAVVLMACGNPASESLQAPAQSQPAQASQTHDTTPPQVAAAPPAALGGSSAIPIAREDMAGRGAADGKLP